MNRAFRLIWNESLNLWQVAGEITRARGKQSRSAQRRRTRRSSSVTLILAGGLMPALATAATLPSGEQVTHGQATISREGDRMIIEQGSERLITE